MLIVEISQNYWCFSCSIGMFSTLRFPRKSRGSGCCRVASKPDKRRWFDAHIFFHGIFRQ
ncbi:MAG: hypothetical protein BM562_12910 [Alphaproteobacteria bacterium MedPE-SWcel]|nr:MAG: hypothetical protein BM562_12910 [Alphaproteobacteria bacterium MedPE-SWcel]